MAMRMDVDGLDALALDLDRQAPSAVLRMRRVKQAATTEYDTGRAFEKIPALHVIILPAKFFVLGAEYPAVARRLQPVRTLVVAHVYFRAFLGAEFQTHRLPAASRHGSDDPKWLDPGSRLHEPERVKNAARSDRHKVAADANIKAGSGNPPKVPTTTASKAERLRETAR
jgi:hypothetical protein